MRHIALWLICQWAYLGLVSGEEPIERVVRIPSGAVRGYKQPGDSVFTFYGIPYATAPKGYHKFKEPLPAPVWFAIHDAVDKGIICPQPTIANISFIENKIMDEDCLIANVYVPETEEKNLPVIVYVHGGAYQVGHGTMLSPINLVRSKKVIAVTFNYRLGIHGFLCLGTDIAPGNAGMKDQVELLRWVSKSIAAFGGNPKDVTIAGYSAGASAVDLLMLSPLAKGLFNKVIPESGANLAPWSIQVDPLENAKYFAQSTGLEYVDDVHVLQDFYTSITYDELISTGGFWNRTDSVFLFSPCVERVTAEKPFLTDNPYNILKRGDYKKVPILYGFANMEGLVRIPEFDTWKDKMNANFSEFLPADLQFETEEERNEMSKRIKEFYFGTKEINNESVLSYIDFIGDIYFASPTLRAIKLHIEAGHDKIFLYDYNFVDDSVPPVPYTNNVRGANHCAQSAAVLDFELIPVEAEKAMSEDLRKMKTVMREIWINFITTGKPVPAGSGLPAWPAAGAEGGPHMSLGRALELRGALLPQRARFWDHIYQRHYRKPQPPPHPPILHTEL